MTLAPLIIEDTDRMAELVEAYASLSLGSRWKRRHADGLSFFSVA